jgi:hypothetical protein
LTREVLTFINELGDAGLAARRQVIKRVSEYDDFSSCYPDNQLKAQGAVRIVAQLVQRKDAFTRIQNAHEQEMKQHREVKRAELAAREATRAALANVRSDLFALFAERDPHVRGKALESILNRLFDASGVLVREAFTIARPNGVGVVEQIDGAITLDGRLYLVEMKWWSEPLGRAEVASHLVSVYGRGEAGGIMISASGYHPSAIEDYKTALSQRTVVLAELKEIVDLLSMELPLVGMLRAKVRQATLAREPLTFPIPAMLPGA